MALWKIKFEIRKSQEIDVMIFIDFSVVQRYFTRRVLRAPATRVRTKDVRVQKGRVLVFVMYRPSRQVPEEGKIIYLVD